jgi:hypothetical protein
MESGGSKGGVYIVGRCFMDKWADRYMVALGIYTPFSTGNLLLAKTYCIFAGKTLIWLYER